MQERTDSLGAWLRRRQLLAFGALLSAAAPAQAAWAARSIPAAEPLRQIRAGGPSGLLAVGASGALWALSASGAAATRLADGLDPLTPLASGHGRIAARHADGGLWVWQGGSMPFVRPHFDELLAAIDFALAKSYPARGEYAGAV